MNRIIPGADHRSRHSIAVDFDGVIHQFISPWTGDPEHIPDPPVQGAIEWLEKMVDDYDVYIFTCRLLASNRSQVERAMRGWFRKHDASQTLVRALRFCYEKPHVMVYLDDRGMRFEGTFPTVEEIVAASIPWNKKGRT